MSNKIIITKDPSDWFSKFDCRSNKIPTYSFDGLKIDEARLLADTCRSVAKVQVMIYNFQNATLPAQSALLKLLEDCEWINFTLVADSLQNILSTVQSRCIITREDTDEEVKYEQLAKKLLSVMESISQHNILAILNYVPNEDLPMFYESLVEVWDNAIYENPSVTLYEQCRHIKYYKQQLDHSGIKNNKVLTNLLLKMYSIALNSPQEETK